MKKIWINIFIGISIIILFFIKDKIYLLFDNETFYPDLVYKDYCSSLSSDEFNFNYDYELTRVLYRDIYSFENEITIYKGAENSFKENMAIIDSLGLVGIITTTNSYSSEVRLLTNEKTSLSIKVNDSYGILSYENKSLIITNLTDNNINIGDIVYTSGLANLYENIPVGVITKEDTSKKNTTYIVDSYANFNDLNYLAVLKGVK